MVDTLEKKSRDKFTESSDVTANVNLLKISTSQLKAKKKTTDG